MPVRVWDLLEAGRQGLSLAKEEDMTIDNFIVKPCTGGE